MGLWGGAGGRLSLAQQANADLLTEEARLVWLATRSRIYQWAEKSSKLLHRLCQGSTSPLTLPAIMGLGGAPLGDPRAIAESFAQYYATLYTISERLIPAQIHRFLDDLPPDTLLMQSGIAWTVPLHWRNWEGH